MDIKISPSILSGRLTVPPSKSLTMRAIFFAFLAKGTSTIKNILCSPDTEHLFEIIQNMGSTITHQGSTIKITGVDNQPNYTSKPLYCGNSGILLRFFTALGTRFTKPLYIYGDKHLNQLRPMNTLVECIRSAQGKIYYIKKNHRAPLLSSGRLLKDELYIDGTISQPVSAMIIQLALHPTTSTLKIDPFEEKNWVLMTLLFLKRLNIPYTWHNENTIHFPGTRSFSAFTYTVPQDMSTLSFPLITSILSKGTVVIDYFHIDKEQKESMLLDLVKKMGAKFNYQNNTLSFDPNSCLMGINANINEYNDALPILSVLACFCKTPSHFYGAKTSRHKECNRISVIAQNLKKMGAKIIEYPDGLKIYPSALHGASLSSHNDHRIAMSSIIASCFASTSSIIENIQCISKSYPNFVEEWKKTQMNAQLNTCSSMAFQA